MHLTFSNYTSVLSTETSDDQNVFCNKNPLFFLLLLFLFPFLLFFLALGSYFTALAIVFVLFTLLIAAAHWTATAMLTFLFELTTAFLF